MNNHHDDTLHTPVEHAEPAKAADELLSHGLLTFMHKDTPAETERRMKGVMRRIADETPRHAAGRNGRFVFPHARRLIALAACFVIAAGLVYLGLPAESTASAMVRQTADVLRSPGERRFEVRVQPRGSKELLENPIGTIDTRGRDLMVLRFEPEEGVAVTIGRDPQGAWIVHPDGHLNRNPPPTMMPRWASVGEQPVAPDSVDRLLEEMVNLYTLERTSEKSPDGKATTEHIVGLRRGDVGGAGAPRIELWIDPQSHDVKKLELFFPPPPEARDGPRGNRGPLGQPGQPGQPGPDGPRGDRPPRPRDGGGPDGLRDDHPDGPGRDMDRDGPGPRRGPEDPQGRGPAGRGGRGMPIRIELRPAPPPRFEDGWFTPEFHAKRKPQP